MNHYDKLRRMSESIMYVTTVHVTKRYRYVVQSRYSQGIIRLALKVLIDSRSILFHALPIGKDFKIARCDEERHPD
jgi:hypothetical protein